MNTAAVQRDSANYGATSDIGLYFVAGALLRRWKTVIGVVALIVAATAVCTEFFVSRTYESTAVVAFRNNDPALVVDFAAFQALASSPTVLEEIVRKMDINKSVAGLRGQLRFAADPAAQQVRVSARANDAHTAVGIIDAWIDVMQVEVRRIMEDRLADYGRITEANYSAALEALTALEDSLVTFDLEHPLELMGARAQRDTRKLVADEEKLASLRSSIIIGETTIAALNEALSRQEVALDVPASGDLLWQIMAAQQEIKWRLATLEGDLAANRRLVELLESELPALEARVVEANKEIANARLQRERLVRSVKETETMAEAVRRERDKILALERELPHRSRIEVISPPILPDQPVSPRKMFNLALSAVLGVLVAVFGVLVAEWWKSASGRHS